MSFGPKSRLALHAGLRHRRKVLRYFRQPADVMMDVSLCGDDGGGRAGFAFLGDAASGGENNRGVLFVVRDGGSVEQPGKITDLIIGGKVRNENTCT